MSATLTASQPSTTHTEPPSDTSAPPRLARGTHEIIPVEASTLASGRVLQRVGHSLVAIDHMVNDLIDLSALAAGRLVLAKVEVDLVHLCRRIAEWVEQTSGCEVTIDARSDVIIHTDAARIERVIANLIWSGVERSPARSTIIRLDRVGRMARISAFGVRQTTPKVVEPRRRHHGLGLFVSRKIVEALGGRVGVESCGALTEIYAEVPDGTLDASS